MLYRGKTIGRVNAGVVTRDTLIATQIRLDHLSERYYDAFGDGMEFSTLFL